MTFKKPSILGKKQSFPIGVDIGDSAMRLLQLRPVGKNGLAVRGAYEIEYPAKCTAWTEKLEFISEHLMEIRKREHFAGNACRISLPSCFTDVVHLQVDPGISGSDRLAAKIPPESIPFDVNDVVVRGLKVDRQVAGSGEAAGERIVMAADRSAVTGVVKMFAKAAMNCKAVSMDASAVMECFARTLRRGADVDRTVLFADLGRSSVQVIIAHGDRMVFARNLAIDPSAQWADRVGSELLNCIRYHDSIFAGRPVAEAVFIGGRANDRPACRQLAEIVALPARVGDPFMGLDTTQLETPVSGPQWAVAIGLCAAAETLGWKESAA